MFHIITVELCHTFGGDRTPMRIVTDILWGQNSNWIVTDILLGGTELQLNCDSHLGGTELLRELWRTFYLYNTGFGLTTIMTDWQTDTVLTRYAIASKNRVTRSSHKLKRVIFVIVFHLKLMENCIFCPPYYMLFDLSCTVVVALSSVTSSLFIFGYIIELLPDSSSWETAALWRGIKS